MGLGDHRAKSAMQLSGIAKRGQVRFVPEGETGDGLARMDIGYMNVLTKTEKVEGKEELDEGCGGTTCLQSVFNHSLNPWVLRVNHARTSNPLPLGKGTGMAAM